MGWLLSGNGKKKKTTRGKGSRGTKGTSRGGRAAPWDPKRTLAALAVVGAFAGLLGFALAWHYGGEALRSWASTEHAADPSAEQVELTDAPAWMSPLVREQLRQITADAVGSDPLDRQGLVAAVEQLRENPWVLEVDQVRRQPGGKVVVDARYREPVALIQKSDGYHLVDAEGVRLPGVYYRHQLKSVDLPVLIHVSAAPPFRGEVWPGEDIQAGLELVRLLAGQPFFDDIEAFDVGKRDQRGRICLALHGEAGGVVWWGLPPGEERVIEADAAVKLAWLRDIVRQRGTVDAGGLVVDVRSTPAVTNPEVTGTYQVLGPAQ
ncbi:MAG: cell division protein FtsQ/DivIB [Phycisphaeraceae bacterium]